MERGTESEQSRRSSSNAGGAVSRSSTGVASAASVRQMAADRSIPPTPPDTAATLPLPAYAEPPSLSGADERLVVLGLEVEIVSGDDLVSCDTLGKSDPYVVASLAGPKAPPGEVRTEFQRRTLTPEWNCRFPKEAGHVFRLHRPPDVVRFVVYDHDRVGSDDFMGCADLTLSAMRADGAQHGSASLTLTPGPPGEFKVGGVQSEWQKRGPNRGLGRLHVRWRFVGLHVSDCGRHWLARTRRIRTVRVCTVASAAVGAAVAATHEPDHVRAYLGQIGAAPFSLFPSGEDSFVPFRDTVPGPSGVAEAAAEEVEGWQDVAERWGDEFADQWERDFVDDVVDVGEVRPEVVDTEEEHIADLREEEDGRWDELRALRREELDLREAEAREKVCAIVKEEQEKVLQMRVRTREYELQAREMVQRVWKQGEDGLLARTRHNSGQLSRYDDVDANVGKRWIAEWLCAPQPIRLTLHCLRGVRDKLPEGYYVLHVAVYDVLGGSPMSYIARAEDECKGNTKPHRYLGKFYTCELPLGETLRLVCPSAALLRSHAVLTFEIWRLKRGKYAPTDRVVGWGGWPLVAADFTVRHGKWKTPILCGAPDRSVGTFTRMTRLMETALHNWLGNLYFTIEPDEDRMARPATGLGVVGLVCDGDGEADVSHADLPPSRAGRAERKERDGGDGAGRAAESKAPEVGDGRPAPTEVESPIMLVTSAPDEPAPEAAADGGELRVDTLLELPPGEVWARHPKLKQAFDELSDPYGIIDSPVSSDGGQPTWGNRAEWFLEDQIVLLEAEAEEAEEGAEASDAGQEEEGGEQVAEMLAAQCCTLEGDAAKGLIGLYASHFVEDREDRARERESVLEWITEASAIRPAEWDIVGDTVCSVPLNGVLSQRVDAAVARSHRLLHRPAIRVPTTARPAHTLLRLLGRAPAALRPFATASELPEVALATPIHAMDADAEVEVDAVAIDESVRQGNDAQYEAQLKREGVTAEAMYENHLREEAGVVQVAYVGKERAMFARTLLGSESFSASVSVLQRVVDSTMWCGCSDRVPVGFVEDFAKRFLANPAHAASLGLTWRVGIDEFLDKGGWDKRMKSETAALSKQRGDLLRELRQADSAAKKGARRDARAYYGANEHMPPELGSERGNGVLQKPAEIAARLRELEERLRLCQDSKSQDSTRSALKKWRRLVVAPVHHAWWGFDTEERAADAFGLSIAEMATEVCMSQRGFLISSVAPGHSNTRNQLQQQSTGTVTFLNVVPLDFSDPDSGAREGSRYFVRSADRSGGQPHQGWVSWREGGEAALRRRLTAFHVAALSAAKEQGVKHFISPCPGLFDHLSGLRYPRREKSGRRLSSWPMEHAFAELYFETLFVALSDVDYSFDVVMLSPQSWLQSVRTCLEEGLRPGGRFNDVDKGRGLRCSVALHDRDARSLAQEVAALGLSPGLVTAVDPRSMLFGCVGMHWERGRLDDWTDEAELAAHSTLPLSSFGVAARALGLQDVVLALPAAAPELRSPAAARPSVISVSTGGDEDETELRLRAHEVDGVVFSSEGRSPDREWRGPVTRVTLYTGDPSELTIVLGDPALGEEQDRYVLQKATRELVHDVGASIRVLAEASGVRYEELRELDDQAAEQVRMGQFGPSAADLGLVRRRSRMPSMMVDDTMLLSMDARTAERTKKRMSFAAGALPQYDMPREVSEEEPAASDPEGEQTKATEDSAVRVVIDPSALPGPRRGIKLAGNFERTGDMSMHGVPTLPKVSFFSDLTPVTNPYDRIKRVKRRKDKARAAKAMAAGEEADPEDVELLFGAEGSESSEPETDSDELPEDAQSKAPSVVTAGIAAMGAAFRGKEQTGEVGVPIMSRSTGKGLGLKSRLERLKHSHDIQVISAKMKDWELLDELDEEAEASDMRGVEFDAGEYDPSATVANDAVPKGRMSIAAAPTAEGLGKIARRLNVLKKMARTGLGMDGPSVDHSEFLQSVSGRRDFFFMPRQIRDKMPFVLSVMYYDMGINPTGRWEKGKTAMAVVTFCLCAHVRTFVHNFGLWIFLSAKFVPLDKNEWMPWGVEIEFNDGKDSIFAASTHWMVLAIGCGPMVCIGLQLFSMLTTVIIQQIFGFFPYVLSRPILWYGVAAALDPLLTATVDLFRNDWRQAEALRLFYMYQRQEGSGFAGVLITGCVYFILFVISATLAYGYMVYWHLDGRIEDVYKRVQSPEGSFYIPYDNEVSKKELDDILFSAKHWRSDAGEVKRVVAEDIDDFEVCCFRERLWVLLDLEREHPDWEPVKWLQEYFSSITLVRPKRAVIRHNLGKHHIARDIIEHLMRFYPFLTSRDTYLAASQKDTYYDGEFQGMHKETTPQQADLREQRMLLMRYFEPQVRRYPCRWVRDLAADLDSDDSAAFGQREPGELADRFHEGMKGLGTDEELIWRTLEQVDSHEEWIEVQKAFARRHPDVAKGDLLAALTDELSGSELSKAKKLLLLNGVVWDLRAPAIADELYDAMHGLGTDEAAVFGTLEGISSESQWRDVRNTFSRAFPDFYGGDLRRALKEELSRKELSKAKGLLLKNRVPWDDGEQEDDGETGPLVPVDPFRVLDAQLLADLIFFETSTPLLRRMLLHKYLGGDLKSRRRLTWFRAQNRHSSVTVQPISAGFLTIYISNARTGERELFRAFVQMPNGALVESVPGSFDFDASRHTTDDPEYWQHKTLVRHAA
eukprot:TRINITY_DN18567_c0_g1_i1.p1 TRINITY_DN18567_c0_g1~~TRINITY_DN18567_c0_g1_i1.p1  ORF type:complete len:2710 (+),score=1057.05 TRINITY_DN18567_c0_g1_i1:44-8131(+)